MRKEQAFLEAAFRLHRADERPGEMFPSKTGGTSGSSSAGGSGSVGGGGGDGDLEPNLIGDPGAATSEKLAAAAAVAADSAAAQTPRDAAWLATASQDAKAAEALSGAALGVLFAKVLQKCRALCEAPDLSTSAELLNMLNVVSDVRRSLNKPLPAAATAVGTVVETAAGTAAGTPTTAAPAYKGNDDDDEDDEDDDDADDTDGASTEPPPIAVGAETLEATETLTTRWLGARLSELSAILHRRWTRLMDDQASWVAAHLTGATDVRQAGVLAPFARFAALVTAVEVTTSRRAAAGDRAAAHARWRAEVAGNRAALAQAAAADAEAAFSFWRDVLGDPREEWEKGLGPSAARRWLATGCAGSNAGEYSLPGDAAKPQGVVPSSLHGEAGPGGGGGGGRSGFLRRNRSLGERPVRPGVYRAESSTFTSDLNDDEDDDYDGELSATHDGPRKSSGPSLLRARAPALPNGPAARALALASLADEAARAARDEADAAEAVSFAARGPRAAAYVKVAESLFAGLERAAAANPK